MTVYRFADDQVESELDLALIASPASHPDIPVNVTISVTMTDSIESPRFSHLLHRGDLDGAPWALGVLANDDGWAAVLGSGCTARISADARNIVLTALHSAPDEWLAEALVNWALVYRLAILGRPSFHASAATLDGVRAVAICGATHSGKSTMAAAALALGGSLLADDVLVPRIQTDAVVVPSTASAVKLRGRARSLADEVAGTITFDDRLRVADAAPTSSLPLSHIVFLDPLADAEVHPLRPDEVAVRLLAESKVGAWLWDDARQREFDVACDLADRVPGFVAGRSQTGNPTPANLLDDCSRLFSV
jgi:hypothetical protein